MSKRAEEVQASAILPESIISYAKEHTVLAGLVYREGVKFGYKQAEKDIWDRIEKYLKTRHHMDYATVGWILNNLKYYKQEIMEEEL